MDFEKIFSSKEIQLQTTLDREARRKNSFRLMGLRIAEKNSESLSERNRIYRETFSPVVTEEEFRNFCDEFIGLYDTGLFYSTKGATPYCETWNYNTAVEIDIAVEAVRIGQPLKGEMIEQPYLTYLSFVNFDFKPASLLLAFYLLGYKCEIKEETIFFNAENLEIK